MPLHIALYQPQIPANTGNIARTCAATGTSLHLIHPLGFSTSDKMLKRAGLDYWHAVNILHHQSLSSFTDTIQQQTNSQLYLIETSGSIFYHQANFNNPQQDIYLLFGQETKGLPNDFVQQHIEQCLRIPQSTDVRSLNLSNTAALVLYEAL
ncbi:tRNA (cytidine(34)-2'-O)-methyltransferase, partial [Neisseriaceae bacterium ESL0693]|nr:tRNA (cytidine(34)-2'-O)-methyltransferase [Neisseriaceae bacterium ESL0693]